MFTNRCGGQRWEMRPDGLIDIEGRGPVAFEPGTVQFEQLTASWENWSKLILDASKRYDLPPSWILAIMTMETGLWSDDAPDQASKVSYAGAIGLMQIMPGTAKMFGAEPEEMYEPAKNIDVGAALLRHLADRMNGELPEMAAAYNSGKVCDPGRNYWNLYMADDYAGNVIKWNNAAVLYMNLSRPHLILGLTLGAAGLYVAAVLAGFAKAPKQLRAVL